MTIAHRSRPALTGARFLAAALGLATVLVVVTSCAPVAKTVYSGTYTRTWMAENGTTQQVSGPVRLTLDESGHFWIEGERQDLPPRGEGRYEREGTLLTLFDRGPVSAGFDLSLIVRGPFETAEDDGTLVLRQENPWGHSHLMLLQRSEPGP